MGVAVKRRLASWAVCFVVLAGACSEEPVAVDFSVREAPAADLAEQSASTLTIGIGAMTGPEETYESHADLMRYLARSVGREAEIVQRRTYQEMNQMLLDEEVDVALICTGAYVAVRDRVDLLAVPLFGGRPTYHSAIIARSGGPQSLAELRGVHFAFTDRLSNTGRLYPIYVLRERFGTTPREFFGEITYSGAHDESVRLVAAGTVDAAAVDELVLRRYLLDHPDRRDRLTVIHESPQFGAPPFVTRRGLPGPLVAELRGALLGAGRDPEAQSFLPDMGIDGFVAEADYSLAIRVAEPARGLEGGAAPPSAPPSGESAPPAPSPSAP